MFLYFVFPLISLCLHLLEIFTHQILKKICDHPLLLTKRAAEDVLEGMDSMLKPEEANVAEKLAMHIADVAGTDKFKDEQDVSCKISFIMSLLVSADHGVYILVLLLCLISQFIFCAVG